MNLGGLVNFLQDHVLALIILVVGVLILTRAHSGDHKGALTSVGVVLIGLMVIGLSVGGNATHVGSWLAGLVGF